MSNPYPIWWDTKITIYNKYEDPITHLISWYKHTVSNCFWKYVGDKINVGNVVLETNNTICRIPKNASFLEKYLWIEIPNDQMENYFTLGKGDILVKGEVTENIDEYTAGHRSSDFVDKYKNLQGCMEVQEIALNIGPGRVCEHYLVRGI